MARQTDATQAEIVSALRQAGCSVHDTHRVGGGFPDLVVWAPVAGTLHLLEVKTPGGRLSPIQREFALRWPVDHVESAAQALRACGLDVVEAET